MKVEVIKKWDINNDRWDYFVYKNESYIKVFIEENKALELAERILNQTQIPSETIFSKEISEIKLN